MPPQLCSTTVTENKCEPFSTFYLLAYPEVQYSHYRDAKGQAEDLSSLQGFGAMYSGQRVTV